MQIFACSLLKHDLRFLAAGLLVCLCGSFVTISIFSRAHTMSGLARVAWGFLTAICAATTIWTTHFMTVLGYRTDIPATFSYRYTSLSMLVALLGTGMGFGLATVKNNRATALAGGVTIGLSIASMHYLGMMAYHVPGIVRWNWACVALSVGVGVVFSTAAVLPLSVDTTRLRTRIFAMAAFGLGIVGLYFCGMAGVTLSPLAGSLADGSIDVDGMVITILVVAMMMIGTGLATYVIDADTRLRSDRRLIAMAFQDPLTRLPNRRALKDAMEAAFATRQWFKLMLIDLDHFKGVNDTFGHAIGDALLVEVGRRLKETVGAEATAYRLGGDELAVTAFTSRQRALQIAQAILDALQQPIIIGNHSIVTGCSIGLCAFDNADDAETLMQRADTALYEAKKRGRGQVFRYVRGMLEAAAERSQLLAALQYASERQQFRLVFQPIFSLKTHEICGYEALLRWHLPGRGDIPPAKFIPIAEESGAISSIGEWVLMEACRLAKAWDRRLSVAVNVSPVQVRSALFPAHVTRALAQSGLDASRLVVELTETAIVADDRPVADVLDAVRLLGVRVAMDDFGTGYSSLSHLRQLPLDSIKIDRSFVTSAEQDRKSMAVLRAIIQIGRDMDIATIAEGVETESQLQMLRSLGCDAAQGYLLGKPAEQPCIPAGFEPGGNRLAS